MRALRRALSACSLLAVGASVAAGPARPASVVVPARLGAQFRYWSFSDRNDNRNPLVYWVPGPFHVQLEVWDFVRGEDQFRPELGVHLRDRRRSSYTAEWRHERDAERITLATEPVLSEHWVGRASVAPILERDATPVVWMAGADFYWRSYDFVSVNVVRDPRGDDLWAVPMRLRLATEADDWVQLAVVPASRRTLGWAADAKLRWLRLGIERNQRYDFSTRDNLIVTAGVEAAIPRAGP